MTVDLRSKVDCRFSLPFDTSPPVPLSLVRSGGVEKERSWEKFAVSSFSIAGSFTLFATVLSGQKPNRFYPYIIASVVLHVGLLTLFSRFMRKQPSEPVEVEFVLLDPLLPPSPEPPPGLLPPGDGGTSPTITKNRGPETPERPSNKRVQRRTPLEPHRPDVVRPPMPTPKIPAGNVGFGNNNEPPSPTTPISENDMIPMPAVEETGGTTQGDTPAETITPLSQLPSQLFQSQSAASEGRGEGGRGPSLFGGRIVNRLTLDKKKKHYQIAFLIDASGSMLYKIGMVQRQVRTIIGYAQAQLEEGGHVTLALWVYTGSTTPLKSLTPEQEFATISMEDELKNIERALDRAAREVIERQYGGDELTWDASMETLRAEPFAASNEIEKVLFVITDDEASLGVETRGDGSCEKVKNEARRRGVRFEVIRTPMPSY